MSELKISGSKADTAIECSGSLVASNVSHNPNSPEGREGTAKHEALAYVARGEEPQIDAIAEAYEIDVDDLAYAIAAGKKAWGEVARWFPSVITEVEVDGPVTRGTADVLCDAPGSLAILDWKTGYSGDEHKHQLMAYADAAREKYGMPTGGVIYGFEVWLRLGEFTTHHFSENQLNGFRSRCAEQIKRASGEHPQYAAGAHCKFCPRATQCEARDEYMRATTTAIAEFKDPTAAVTRATIGALYERSKLLHRALAEYDKLLDAELVDGPIALADGRILRLKDTEQDVITNAPKVLQVIRENIDIDIESELKITKASIERACKASAPKGSAAALTRSALSLLRQHDLIEKTIIKRKEIVQP